MIAHTPTPMTQAEMHQATGLGPEWRLISEGQHALPCVQHLCGGLYGPDGIDVSEWVPLPYRLPGGPGIEAAWLPGAGSRGYSLRVAARQR